MFLVACSYVVYYSSKFLPISLEQISPLELHIVIYGSMSILSAKALCLWSLSQNHHPETCVHKAISQLWIQGQLLVTLVMNLQNPKVT